MGFAMLCRNRACSPFDDDGARGAAGRSTHALDLNAFIRFVDRVRRYVDWNGDDTRIGV